ncbi:hypothetical protein [Pseudoxanthomonas sp.]|uniref:hypothetical protein n=1 Tax=Pseudoxanthomonas sp. TaxID=1871049 RepID=UPI002589FBF5|nr:hypothetical protein [Pseudoxanthomonas sp.]MCR6687451.1 hypothetical protein [Pseudoxanthomonas sp.]
MDASKAKASDPKDRDFSFARKRGVVWVCDIAGSSRYLNDDASAQDLEDFLPRLYRTSAIMVEAAGGEFIKWTGDGFLAWFETPLHRDLKKIASTVFQAAFHLTVLVNVTQLGVASGKKFKLRHGVAYEKDALVTTIKSDDGVTLTDLIGRDVVLAFRLSGIEAQFPSIVTQRELADAHKEHAPSHINFAAWRPSKEDRLKFFKGEARGLSSICVTGARKLRTISKQAALKRSKSAIAAAEGRQPAKYPFHEVWDRFDPVFLSGPSWCRDVMAEYLRFIKDDLLGSLKGVVAIMEEVGADEERDKQVPGDG